MNISSLTSRFSLRDYIAYLFPGVLLLGSIGLIMSYDWDNLTQKPFQATILILVVGYMFGFVSRSISSYTIEKLLDRIFGEPMKGILKSPNEKEEDIEPFKLKLNRALVSAWGEDIVKGDEVGVMSLCWRDIQRTDHQGIDYLFRIVDLFNVARNMIFPSLCIALVFLYKEEYLYSLCAFAIFVSMCHARFHFMKEFPQNVYKIWYVIYRDKYDSNDSTGRM